MSQDAPQYVIVPEEDSRALETLWKEARAAQAALGSIMRRVQGTGKVQRISGGVWAILSAPAPATDGEPPAEPGGG